MRIFFSLSSLCSFSRLSYSVISLTCSRCFCNSSFSCWYCRDKFLQQVACWAFNHESFWFNSTSPSFLQKQNESALSPKPQKSHTGFSYSNHAFSSHSQWLCASTHALGLSLRRPLEDWASVWLCSIYRSQHGSHSHMELLNIS